MTIAVIHENTTPQNASPDFDYGGIAETYLAADAASTAFGSDAELRVWQYSGYHKRSIVAFTGLSNISSGVTASGSSSIFLWCHNPSGAGSRTINAYRMLVPWTEATATWNTYDGATSWPGGAGLVSGTDYAASASGSWTGSDSAPFWMEISGAGIGTDAAGFVNGTYSNYGWVLIHQTASASDRMYSTDAPYSTLKPELVFNYTVSGGDPEGRLIGGKLIRGGLLRSGVL